MQEMLHQHRIMDVDELYERILIAYTQGDSGVISSYHIYASCFPAIMWGKLCKYFLLRHHFLCKTVIIRTFSSINWSNFIRITTKIFTTELRTVRRVAPQHRDRNVTTDHCDITWPYVQDRLPDI